MRKGKTKKTNFTGLARRTLAGALSLSMVFGTNIMTMADGGASTTTAPITFGKEVDFSTAGVVLAKDGNAAAIDGTTLTLGAAATTPSGVEIVNPFAGNTTLASETVADALENSGTKFNGYLFRHGTGDAAKDTYYIANITSKAQAEELAATGAVSIVTDAAAMTAYNGNWELNKGIQVINTANLVSATAEAAEVSLPVPEWKNGITVSAWVKASSKDYAPIFVFNNESVEGRGKSAGLAMFTDGSVVYEHGKNQNSRISVQYGGDATPANNVGKWVYVTLTVKNDGFEVYYNGQKASITKDKYSQTKSGIKYTNYGYGYVDGKDTASRIAGRVSSNGYAQRLTGLTVETLNAAPSTIFNYKAWASGYDSNQSKYPSIMEYLTKADTKLYIGGVAEGTCFGWNNLANGKSDNFAYRAASEGLAVSDITLEDTVIDSEAAQIYYENAETPIDPTEEAKVLSEKAVSVDSKDVIASGNAATVNKATVKLGASATTPSGVEVTNPYAGNETLASETVAEALKNSGTKFNGYLFRHGTGDANDTYYIANITSKAQAEELAATGAISIVTDAAAMTAYNGNWELNKGIQVINTANLVSATAEAAEVSLPVPEWKNGITVSTWVKAATSEAVAPIFVFNNESVQGKGKSAGLAMFTDGSVIYEQGGNKNNRISVQYGGDATPIKHVGEWVYVTLTVKNDGFEVYYNGQKASVTKDKYNQGKGNIKYTNYGFGYADSDLASRIAKRVGQGAYSQRITGLTAEVIKANPSVITNYSAWAAGFDSHQSEYPSIMEYLTKADTKLYIGGLADGICYDWNGLANGTYSDFSYTAASEGMEVSDMTLDSHVIDKNAAWIYYKNAKNPDEEVVTPSPEPTTGAAVTTEPAATTEPAVPTAEPITRAAIASYDYTIDDDENINGVDRLNSDLNKSEISKDEFGNSTIKLGVGADGEIPKGVRITNPFKKNTELHETLVEALENTGVHFNGWTKAVSGSALGSSTDYYQVQDSATREDAINKFNETNKKKIEEYKRQQITSYAKSITVTGGGVEISGDGVTTSVVAVKTDADMSLMDIMSVNARVYYQTKDNVDNMTKFDGTTGRVNIASGKNLAKVLNNLSMYVDVDTILSWTGGYIKSYDECLAANKLGKTLDEYIGGVSPEITTTGEYAFPYPTWTKGVSVSTWVKVPAKAEDTTGSAASGEAVTDEAVTYPTVFEFSDNVASLYLKSDGTLKFMASSDISSNAGKNMFMAEFAGETPAKHAGEWVYVTLTVSNDNIDVYYNGVKATMKSKFAHGSTQTKYFNYGTGYGTADIDARIKACVEGNNYRDLLENYGMSTTYDDYSKYKFNTTDNYLLMVDFLTQDKTNLFFGGNDQGTESNYTDVNAGMEYGAISFYDYVAADSVVADQYEAAKKIREKAETPSPEPTTPAPTTSAPATTAPATPTPTTPVTPGPTTPAPATPTPTTPVTPGPTTPAPANTVLGDANLDNKVDLQDAVVVLKAALNINELTGQAAINADADKNGKVDLQDAVLVLKAALNILELK